MKTGKKLLALLLAAMLLVTVLAACGTQEEPAPSQNGTAGGENPASPEQPDAELDEEPTDVVFYYFTMNQNSDEGMDRVAEAVNEITLEKLNIRVDLHSYQLSEFRTAIPIMIAGGETLDLFNLLNGALSFPTLMANGSLRDIAELLPTYAPDAYALVSDTIGAYTVNGGIYAVTNYRNFNSNQYVMGRKDVLEQLGLVDAFNAMTTWSDWEAICAEVVEKTDYVPMGGAQSVLFQAGTPSVWYSDSFEFVSYDTLSDATNLLRAENGDATVKYIYEQDDTVWTLDKIRQWNDNGWIYPETYISEENNQILMKNNVIFGAFAKSEIGAAQNWSSRTGVELLACQLSDTPVLVTTGQIQMGSLVVPITTEEPEAAVRLINELYTNAELLNLLGWGIEGVDYVVNEAGEACYPNGDSSVSYHNMDYTMGNFFLYLPWDGNGADYREVCQAEAERAALSDYLGFQLDATDYEVQVSQLVNVYNEYGPRLNSGLYSEELLAEMNAKMEASGLRDYIAGVQTQLDAWLSAH